MSEDRGDRTEAPTPKKREESRKKGQVPKTQEAGAAVILVTSGLLLQSGGAGLGRSVAELFGNSVRLMSTPAGPAGAPAFLEGVGWTMLGAMAPLLAALAGVALAVGAIQGRGVLSVEPIKPKAEKLDPVKGAQKVWGWKAVAEFAKSLLKLTIAGGAIWLVLGTAMDDLPALSQQSPLALLSIVKNYGSRVLLAAGVAFVFLALADYGFQVWQNERELKMSRQDIKDETKESEGDPHVKARRRSMAGALARRRMMLSVSEADVVVTNPTHVAVALQYDPLVSDAPIVLAMGERKVAERIKARAREAGVPVLENKPLARALLASAEVGAPIPVELYRAVAEVLAWVFRQRGGYSPPDRR